MSIILDLAIVALIVTMAVSDYKKGLISSLVSFAGMIVSSIAASFTASMISFSIYNQFIMNRIINTAEKAFSAIPSSYTVEQQAERLMSSLPNYASNALYASGINTDILSSKINSTDLAVPELIETLVRPTAIKLMSAIFTVILFVVFSTVIFFLAKIITKTVNAVGLGTANKVCGAVCGIVKAIILVTMLSLILYFIIMFLPDEVSKSINDSIEQSFLYNGIYHISLPNTIISWFSFK